MRKINTLRFGELEIEEKDVIRFADGIPAFEDEHEFVVLSYLLRIGEYEPFAGKTIGNNVYMDMRGKKGGMFISNGEHC